MANTDDYTVNLYVHALVGRWMGRLLLHPVPDILPLDLPMLHGYSLQLLHLHDVVYIHRNLATAFGSPLSSLFSSSFLLKLYCWEKSRAQIFWTCDYILIVYSRQQHIVLWITMVMKMYCRLSDATLRTSVRHLCIRLR